MRTVCLELLAVQPGERILDIGCGPAYYRKNLPEDEYFGFDTDERYIKYAQSRFAAKGTFICDEFDRQHAHTLGKFDCVILMGLLHHLDDVACSDLLALTASSLKSQGRVMALDTVIHDRQNYFERRMAESDRGQYVRRPEDFKSLAYPAFSTISGRLIHAWWIPSIYWAMILKNPRAAGVPAPSDRGAGGALSQVN